MSIVTINVPDEVIYNLYNSEKEFVDYVRMTIAKELYWNKGVCLVLTTLMKLYFMALVRKYRSR